MRRTHTTTSCRAFALIALLIAFIGLPFVAHAAAAGDRPPPPKLPLAEWWTVALEGKVSSGPVADGARIYVAYASGSLVALAAADGHELWRQKKDVSLPMAASGELLFVSSGEAIEALRATTGAAAWIVPRTKTTAPLVAQDGWVVATTESELIAIDAESGKVAWRRAAGGVMLPPAVNDRRLFTGAVDGRVLAMQISDGAVLWDKFYDGGITAIAAGGGRVYVGTGEKRLYSLDAAKGSQRPERKLGAQAIGRIAVDDDRVYVAALDNTVRAFDRENGNQRWQSPVRQRPLFGVTVSGHIVFVPATASDMQMLWDRSGIRCGALLLPGEAPPGLTPAIADGKDGPVVYVVTGGLTNEWHLTKFAPAGEAALVPLATLDTTPGPPFLTDPELKPVGNVLGDLIIGDPPLQPFAAIDFPIVLTDPPLVPLTTLPGLQLRPLSPVLPVRRGGPAPND